MITTKKYSHLITNPPTPPRGNFEQSLLSTWLWAQNGFAKPRPLDIRSRTYNKFFEALKQRQPKTHGSKYLRLSFSKKAHPCPIHEAIAEVTAIYQDLLYEYYQTDNETTRELLLQRLHLCSLKLQTYHEHMEKYKYQRPAARAMEDRLKDNPGMCVVQEDFCADYEIDGFKMINLIITLIYWDSKTGKLEHRFLDQYSRGSVNPQYVNDDTKRGSADSFLQKAIWLRVLKHNKDFFKQFHTFVKSNDNGASIKNSATFYFAGRLSELYAIRTIWLFLCPYHACNRCDQHGGVTKGILRAKQRKMNKALASARAHAEAINERKIPNTLTALAVDAIQEYDIDLPAGLCKKADLPHQVYGLRTICNAYFEIPDIYDTRRHAQRTITWTGVGLAAPNAKTKEYAFQETRPEAKDPSKICYPCTKKFHRIVLKSEHDQSKHYLCPVTQIYSIESRENLQRKCAHCGQIKLSSHPQGKKMSCPTLQSPWNIEPEGYHKSVRIWTLNGPQYLTIIYSKPAFVFELGPLKKVVKANTTVEDLSRVLIPKMLAIYKKPSSDPGLPWGLGICQDINYQDKTYLLRVYEMQSVKLRNKILQDLSPLGKWLASANTVTVKWDSPLIFPIKLAYGQISLWDLYKIIARKEFQWNNIASIIATELARLPQNLLD